MHAPMHMPACSKSWHFCLMLLFCIMIRSERVLATIYDSFSDENATKKRMVIHLFYVLLNL
jgi:hypothetical protein